MPRRAIEAADRDDESISTGSVGDGLRADGRGDGGPSSRGKVERRRRRDGLLDVEIAVGMAKMWVCLIDGNWGRCDWLRWVWVRGLAGWAG